ncbi:MAG: Ig-like domain-containing protein [Clostridia bacterium]|nr:Ig-like domain-containing protein [Clostridia bacterium]
MRSKLREPRITGSSIFTFQNSIILLLATIIILLSLPITTFSRDITDAKLMSQYSYDVELAMKYAAENCDKNPEQLCAEFVSRCVMAGGLDIEVKTTTYDCYCAILDVTGLEGKDLVLNSSGYATKAENENILSRGDVVIQWCYSHNTRPHILICSGYNESGSAIFYAHNSSLNNGEYRLGRNTSYEHDAKCNMGAKVIHFPQSVPTTPTITFPVTNGDLPGYSGQATYTNFWNLDTDGSSIDFHWTSDNATQYNYSVKKLTANPNPSSENEGIGVSCTELSQTSVRLPVEYGTWYKIGVCAINSAGESSWKIHYVRTRAQSPTVTSPTGLTSSSGYVSKTITAGESVTYAWNASQNVTNSYFHLIELSGTPDPASESEPYSKRIAAGETSYGSSGTYTYSEFEAGKWYKMTVETQNQNYTGIYTPTKWLINPVYIYAEAPTATSTINFDANGGSGAPSPITAAVGNTVTISATQPTRSGYTFLGWNYASNATVGSIQPGGRFTMLKIDVTLYAIWSENSVAVTGLTISDSSLTMKIGETKTITAAVSPANAANKAISWRCRGSAVTFDSETGLITAVAEGSATITATAEDGGFSASCTVTVESDAGQDLTGIAWRDYNNNDTITWEVDLSNEPRPYRLFYTTLPEGALYENITITYSNPIISASVNESANTISITPRSAGESIITLAVDGHEISINFIVKDTSAVSPDNDNITINASDGQLGDTITVAVNVDSDYETIGGSFNLCYDSSKMELISTAKGNMLGSVEPIINDSYAQGQIRVTFASVNALPASGTIVTATFRLTQTGSAEFSTANLRLGQASGEYIYCKDAVKNIVITQATENIVDSGVDSNGIAWKLDANGVFTVSGIGAMADYTSTSAIPWYADRLNVKKIIISEGVTAIGSRAFYGCINLQQAYISDSVLSIGTHAFRNCDEMTIYATSNSYAKTYASENAIPFVDTSSFATKELVVDFAETSARWYFDITVENCTETATVYAGIYDDEGKLLSMKRQELAKDDTTSVAIEKSTLAAYAKIFVWNSIMRPITEAKLFNF